MDFQAVVDESEMGVRMMGSLYPSISPPSTLYLIPFLGSSLSMFPGGAKPAAPGLWLFKITRRIVSHFKFRVQIIT